MLVLYNRMTLRNEPFTADGDQVGVYVCGIAPSESAHLGHAFSYVHFDVLVRYLRHLGHRVVYVQNLIHTDHRCPDTVYSPDAEQQGIRDQNSYRFLADMQWLGNLAPNIFPQVSDVIPVILDHIATLLEGGWAYVREGDIYFSAAACKHFGRLSKLPREKWLATAYRSGGYSDDPGKRDPLDVLLWRSARPGEPGWESSWGKGRPGWHAQCPSIAMKFLGRTGDINGGSADLVFPHHECSAAQSESVTGHAFSRYWMHTENVYSEGRIMRSRSANPIFLRDLRHMSGNAVRISVLDHHYIQPWHFDQRDLRMAKETDELFRLAGRRAEAKGPGVDPLPFEQGFYAAMNDTLNTPRALGVLRRTAIEIMREKSRSVRPAQQFLVRALRLLGLTDQPDAP